VWPATPSPRTATSGDLTALEHHVFDPCLAQLVADRQASLSRAANRDLDVCPYPGAQWSVGAGEPAVRMEK
jgi:hypothetical protein